MIANVNYSAIELPSSSQSKLVSFTVMDHKTTTFVKSRSIIQVLAYG